MPVVMLLGKPRIGKQRDRLPLVQAPGTCCPDLKLRIVTGESAVIGGEHIVTLVLRDQRGEPLPFVRKHLRHAELVEPVELGLRAHVDSAQHELRNAAGVRLRIG